MLFKNKETGALIEADKVKVFNQGGGFVHTMPMEDFIGQYEPTTVPAFHAATVDAEWWPGGFAAPCYSNGMAWNGCGKPHFEKHVLLDLIQKQLLADVEYDEAKDSFIANVDGEDDEYPAMTITVDGIAKTVYPVGAGSWAWYRCEPVATAANLPAAQTGSNDLDGSNTAVEIVLPVFGIRIKGSMLTSNLLDGDESAEEKAAINAVAAMVLAQATAGVNVQDSAYLEALETAVQAIWNHF